MDGAEGGAGQHAVASPTSLVGLSLATIIPSHVVIQIALDKARESRTATSPQISSCYVETNMEESLKSQDRAAKWFRHPAAGLAEASGGERRLWFGLSLAFRLRFRCLSKGPWSTTSTTLQVSLTLPGKRNYGVLVLIVAPMQRLVLKVPFP